jgi:hypothetical protein
MKGSAQRAFTYEPPQVAAKGDAAGAEPPYDSWDNERFFTRTSGILHRGNEIVERRGAVREKVLQGNNIALEGPRDNEEPCLAHLIYLTHTMYMQAIELAVSEITGLL